MMNVSQAYTVGTDPLEPMMNVRQTYTVKDIQKGLTFWGSSC